jgi:hypothetical protein
MTAHHDDPVVSLDDIAEVRRQLFRRWIPGMSASALKLLGLWLVVSAALYYFLVWLNPERSRESTLVVVLVAVAFTVLIPFSIHVWSALRLDHRIARRLDEMARRVRAGEPVRASEVRL